MNSEREMQTTIKFVGAALGTALLALLSAPSVEPSFVASDYKIGEFYFPELNKDTNLVKGLEVFAYSEDTATVTPFKIMFQDGKWVIPSHENYPADAFEKIGKVSAALFDLKRDMFITNQSSDFARLKVLDPTDEKHSEELTGLGTRVNLLDASGTTIASFIFGAKVEGKTGYRYIRLPAEPKAVYASVVQDVDISTKFSDWIETDLLQLESYDLADVTVYNFDLVNRGLGLAIDQKETIHLKKGENDWTMDGLTETEELNSERVSKIETGLDQMVLTGVARKPASLRKIMEGQGNGLTREDESSLAQRGFFVTSQGELVSRAGQVEVGTKKGLRYLLRFGELSQSLESGGDLSKKDEKDEKDKTPDDGAPKDGETNSKASNDRYLLVSVALDEDALDKPSAPVTEGLEEKEKTAKEDEYKKKLAEFETRKADAEKRVKELTRRFAEWYYKIAEDKFREFRSNRKDLVKAKEKAPEEPGKAKVIENPFAPRND